ncbi:MAG: BACON domain-containing protein [Prevotella sp.]|nr:BACON domain-containing protein [Prevotella sp.]
MRHKNILSILTKGLLTATLALSATEAAWAQGITVNTKDGKSVDYPAEQFSFMSPYIREVSTTTYTQGAVATLQYEKAADLNVARTNHQVFATSAGLVVIGGHTNYVVPTETAELWQNGQWKTVATNGYPYDTGFSVTLSDGRVMVGGGYSGIGGVGGSAKTCIFNPATQTFTNGPEMNTARSNCKAITTSRGVYVSGNYGSSSTDTFFDFYNGSTFAKVGNPDPHYRPYLFTDTKGNIYTLSTLDNKGNTIALKTSSSGVTSLYGDKYDVASDKDFYFYYQGYISYMPLVQSADIRTEEYRRTDRNGFLVLTKNAAGNYLLTEPCPDDATTYNHTKFDIPSRHPVTNALITWRGSVYVNNAKNEAYLIGSSGEEDNYTIHVISYNYKDYNWTIASASGFSYNLTTASWTLMADGRLACTGGNTKSDARKDFYIITPPTAGMESSSGTKSYGIDIFKTDGTSDRYMESELTSITTYMPKGDDEKGTWETTTVPQTGGKASKGMLTVDFPASTFSDEAKVSIVEVKQGYVDGDDELSQYYKVKLPGGVNKPFKVSIEMPKMTDDDHLVRMQTAMIGWAPSLLQETLARHYSDITYQDGAYVAEIPAMEDPEGAGEVELYFGITKCNPYNGPDAARAMAGESSKKSFTLYNQVPLSMDVLAVLAKSKEWISNAIAKLEDLGFRRPEGSVIDCYLLPDGGIWDVIIGGGISGWCSYFYVYKNWASINLNYSAMIEKSDMENQGTIIHELFHYYQQFYDPRFAFRQRFDNVWTKRPLILEEASSVWSEGYYVPTPRNAIESAKIFVSSIDLGHKEIFDTSGDEIGYGASTLLAYLSQKCGEDIILDLWERRKQLDWSDIMVDYNDIYDTKGIIEHTANDHGIDIFSQKEYYTFLDKLGTKQVYEGIDFENIVGRRVIIPNDTIGFTTRNIENTQPAYFRNWVFGYGALVEKLEISNNFQGLDHATGLIEQTMEGLTTWVYRRGTQGIELCDRMICGSRTKILPEWVIKKDDGTYEPLTFYLVTIADDFKTEKDLMSRIVAKAFTLEKPENVVLPADYGSKDITIKTNCTNCELRSTEKWLNCVWNPATQTAKLYFEALPDGVEQRKAKIQILVPSDPISTTDPLFDEFEVTQASAYITLAKSDVEIPVDGGTAEVSISATNCDNLTVSSSYNFLHPTINGTTISIKADPNSSYDQREGYVEVSGVEPVLNISVRTRIHVTQAGSITPEPVDLYDDGFIQVVGNKVYIPGKTVKYGDYLLYRSKDTQVEGYGSNRQELSWDVKIYIDPKDNKSMRHYKFYSGSVTWLLNRYWTSKESGKEVEHQETTRCSYNLKNLKTTDGREYYSAFDSDNGEKRGDFISDYSYEVIRDGQTTQIVTQADIANQPNGYKDAWVGLSLADGVPYLEADRDSIDFHGGDTFEILKFDKNEVVQDVQITTSADWMFIDRVYKGEYGGHYYINTTINKSKAPRTGYVYITGTLPGGKKLTRTVVVSQEYDPTWDDEITEQEDQKAELPSQAVLDALRAHGMPIYLGNEPPRLNGTYIMEPLHTIYESNNESGGSAAHIDRLVFYFSTISGRTDRASMSYYSHLIEQNINTAADDYLCYFGGYSDFFTLSNIQVIDYGYIKFSMVTVITGEIDNGSIKNLHFAHVDLDEDGNIENISIGIDGDGLSLATEWNPGTESFARKWKMDN